ncbi:MAG: AmmeMemoRadiSam system protein B [Terriglobia bacterium]
MRRRAAVAGRFYPADPEVLRRELAHYVGGVETKHSALGCVVPHAGIMYSGHVAGAVYAQLQLPARFIILCPNHSGQGVPLSIMSEGVWETPFGDALIDAPLAHALKQACPHLEEDIEAHRLEHSLEVQLPFLQYLLDEFRFVPIAVGLGRYPVLEELGHAVAAVVEKAGDSVLVIASSDMNHYERDEQTRIKDRKAIDRILALDPKGLFDTVQREAISMCGYGPTVAMLTAAKDFGARQAELVRYATSGDVTGDRTAVVGYAGIIVR